MLLAFPLNPQYSHSYHWRIWSHFHLHVSFPQFGQVSGCEGFGATHASAIGFRMRPPAITMSPECVVISLPVPSRDSHFANWGRR